MTLFRRKARPRDEPAAPAETPAAPGAARPGPPRAAKAAGPSVALPPPGTPPPLPRRAPEDDGTGSPSGSLSRCFVCRSPLEAGRCPQCRLTWVE